MADGYQPDFQQQALSAQVDEKRFMRDLAATNAFADVLARRTIIPPTSRAGRRRRRLESDWNGP